VLVHKKEYHFLFDPNSTKTNWIWLIWETDKTRYVSELDPKWSCNIHYSELHLEISRSESGKIPAYQNERKPETYLVWTRGHHRRKLTRFESDKIMFHLEIRFTCFYSVTLCLGVPASLGMGRCRRKRPKEVPPSLCEISLNTSWKNPNKPHSIIFLVEPIRTILSTIENMTLE
jgi:hypothetical protein